MTSKLASLHAGLVARKGEAMPAISHPMFSYVDTPRPVQAPAPQARQDARVERPAWPPVARQIAVEVATPKVQTTPTPEVSAHIQAKPAPDFARPSSERAAPKAAHVEEHAHDENDADHLQRHRFTFRMSASQRRRLRLAAAVQDRSLQHLLSDALDNHLEGLCACSLKSCACLAAAEARDD